MYILLQLGVGVVDVIVLFEEAGDGLAQLVGERVGHGRGGEGGGQRLEGVAHGAGMQ